MAFGALAALHRQMTEGGSWLVQVSLARTGHWLRSLGRVPAGFAVPEMELSGIDDLLERNPSGFGPLTALRHAAQLSRTPARWDRPAVPLGTHSARWP